MNVKNSSRIAVRLIAAVVLIGLAGGEHAMADVNIYRASLTSDKSRTVVIKQIGAGLAIHLEGFGRPIVLKANGGGTSTCRTIVEHNSEEGFVRVSLAIPDARARCRMLPSHLTVESRSHNLSIDEESLKKIAGVNSRIRATVQKFLGKIEEPES